MNEFDISCQLNTLGEPSTHSSVSAFANQETARNVMQFHASLPEYTATPLVDLSQLSNFLGIKKLYIKDESHRFELNAFKMLGASYAMARHLASVLELEKDGLRFADIVEHKDQYQHLTFVTATDGNHGRAVAWAAKQFGCQAVVYMPKGSSEVRLNAIRGYGAEASIVMQNYDNTVIHAKQMAEDNGWVLIQDTAWDGYTQIPQSIMQGYFSLVTESVKQGLKPWPTHVFLQTGVGSLAAAIIACMRSFTERPTPKFIVVEPHGAPCFFESGKRGKAFRVEGDLNTMMAGLACGEPSTLAWELIKKHADTFLSCSDEVACRGMRVLGNPLKGDQYIISGESGAVTLGAVFEILSNARFNTIKEDLALNQDSSILLFSTEGDTDEGIYRDTVWGG